MFDTLRCEYPLPTGYEHMQDREFQTKSFSCLMEDYTITKDGRLILHKAWVWDKESRSRVVVEKYDMEVPYHGDVIFCDFYDGTLQSELIDFVARFTHGTVEWLMVMPLEG